MLDKTCWTCYHNNIMMKREVKMELVFDGGGS